MSAVWIEPITDREESDIKNKTPKAYINVADLNRIEGNVEYLTEKLNEFLFSIQTRSKTDWDNSKIPFKSDIERISKNVTKIKDSYYRPNDFKDIPNLENKRLDYEDINLIEKDLQRLKRLLDRMIADFKKPSFKSGVGLFLPKRRAQ